MKMTVSQPRAALDHLDLFVKNDNLASTGARHPSFCAAEKSVVSRAMLKGMID